MTLNTQSLRKFAKNTLCVLELKVISFTDFMKYVKVVDSCWISSTEWSDTFRSFFVYGKKQEPRKKI